MEKRIDFYVDPISPYVWLAAEQLGQIEEAGGEIVCRPVLFAGLLNAHATKGPAEVPAKRAYVFRDVMRQATRLGLRFQGPPNHPFNPLRVLRAATAIPQDDLRLRFLRVLLSAIWGEGRDPEENATLRDALEQSGVEAAPILAALEQEPTKKRLRETTQEALERGIFGVPSFFFRGEIFWGADRMDALVWALQGGSIDEAFYLRAIERPASATREREKK